MARSAALPLASPLPPTSTRTLPAVPCTRGPGMLSAYISRVCSRLTLFRSWGSNGYKNWNCYKDNGRQLYRTSGPEWSNTCYSVYYCIPQ